MYLLACAIVLGFAALQSLRSMSATLDSLAAGDRQAVMRQSMRNLGLALLPAGLMAAPLLVSFADALRFTSGKPVALSDGRITIAVGLVGALAVLAVAVVRGLRRRAEPKPSFWFVGWLVGSVLSSGVAVMATGSQLAFTSSTDSGMVSFGFFRDQVKDMQCDSDIILARWDRSENSPVVYRCPKAYLLNRYATAPFVPWPDYTEGSSADLASALHATLKDAEKVE